MDNYGRWTNRDGYDLDPVGYDNRYNRLYNVIIDPLPPLWMDDDGLTMWEMPAVRGTDLGSIPQPLQVFNALSPSRNEPEYIYHDGIWRLGGCFYWRDGIRRWAKLTRGQGNRILQSMIRSRGGWFAQWPIRIGVAGGNWWRTVLGR